MTPMRPVLRPSRLYYRASCAKCRLLSALAVIISARSVHRIPLDSAEAAALHRKWPETRGKLALERTDSVTTGWRVVPAALLASFLALWGWVRGAGAGESP